MEIEMVDWITLFVGLGVMLVLFALFYRTPFEQGEEDFLSGLNITCNPFEYGSWQYECWREGFEHQMRMARLDKLVKEKEQMK